MSKSKIPLLLAIFFVLLLGWLGLPSVMGDAIRIDLQFHTALEMAGALAAILMSLFLFHEYETKKVAAGFFTVKLFLLACGFLGMGLFDAFHAVSRPEHGFVLLRTVSNVWGSLWFVLIWAAPSRTVQKWVVRREVPPVLAIGCTVLGLFVMFYRGGFPTMVEGRQFTMSAVALNTLAGVFFLGSAARLFLDCRRLGGTVEGIAGHPGPGGDFSEDFLLFALVAAQLGLAGLTFSFATPWAAQWWGWHILRLAAFLLTLGWVFARHRKINTSLAAEIFERKQVEKTLRDSQELFEKTFNAQIDGILVLDNSNPPRVLSCNPAAARVYGCSREQLLNKTASDLHVDEGSRARFGGLLEAAIAEKGFCHIDDFPMKNAAGVTFPTEQSVAQLLDGAGAHIGWVGAVRDITSRKVAETALKESEQRYRELADLLPVSVFETDESGNLTFLNRAAFVTFGYSKADLEKGLSCFCMVAPDEREAARQALVRGLSVGGIDYAEFTGLRKCGTTFPICIYPGRVLRAAKPVGIRGIAVDLTERREAQRALRESEEKYRELVESANSIIIRMDAGGKMTFVNEFAQKFYGYCEEELLEKDPVRLIRPEQDGSGQELASIFEDILRHPERYINTEGENIRKNGERVWVAWTNRAICDDAGQVCGVLSIGNDITERKRVQDDLFESERQRRVLSAKILLAQEEERKKIVMELHDSIGSSLCAVKLALEDASRQFEDLGSPTALLETSLSWTQFAIDEARRLMMDIRPSMIDDLGLLATLGWFLRQHRKIHPVIHIEEGFDVTESDIPGPLKIVIFRIVQEAFNNISKYSKAEYVSLSLAKTGGAVSLSVEDNGDGFDVQAAFSAKNSGKGLGLAGMKERAELSGGEFSIESTLGEGTLIRALWRVDG